MLDTNLGDNCPSDTSSMSRDTNAKSSDIFDILVGNSRGRISVTSSMSTQRLPLPLIQTLY